MRALAGCTCGPLHGRGDEGGPTTDLKAAVASPFDGPCFECHIVLLAKDAHSMLAASWLLLRA